MDLKERYAQNAITRGLEQMSREEALLSLYERYCCTGDDLVLQDILLYADKLAGGIAKNTLSKSPLFRDDDFEDYLQIIRFELYGKLKKDLQQGKRQDNIIITLKRFYRFRAVDIMRKLHTRNSGVIVESLDELNETPDGDIREVVEDENDPLREENVVARELKELYTKLISIYLRNMMNYEHEPQKPLGLCYARILYQIERRNDPGEIIVAAAEAMSKDKRKNANESDKLMRAMLKVKAPATATSVKWATRKMKAKDLQTLFTYSERLIQIHCDPSLSWGQCIINKLPEISPYCGGIPWRNIIYTDVFTERQTSDWAESIHKSVVKASVLQIVQDEELKAEVIQNNTPFKRFVTDLVVRGRKDASPER